MNGRIYDPKLGRMLQADPFVQNPKNSQSLNRYSYVLNNPLSYTDPSGYFSLKKFVKKYWRVIVAAVATYVTWGAVSGWAATFAWGSTMGTTATLTAAGSAVAGAVAGAVGGAILTGTVKGAFYGALSGAALGAISATSWNNTTKSLASGTASGVTTELQGGKFGHGFISAGVGFWTGLKFGGSPNFGKFMGTAIAGGTISQITGGKFGNGAISAGLAYVVAAGASRSSSRDLTSVKASEMTDAEFAFVFGTSGDWYAIEWGDPLPQWSVDLAAGFGDTFGAGYLRDWIGINGGINFDSGFYVGGQVAGTFTPGLGTAAALRGGALLGGTRAFRVLNGNRYFRLGPGRMPANSGMQAGPKIPRMSIGRGPGNPHIDLRVRPFDG